MLVVGDSHVRRMQQHAPDLANRLRNCSVEWWHRGGAVLADAERISHQTIQDHRVVVLMVGGNDLANGTSPDSILRRWHELAKRWLGLRGVRTVVLPMVWPRGGGLFNRRARSLSERLQARYQGRRDIVYWEWDRRQPWKTVDGVHLSRRGYRRALRYLVAVVVWTIHHTRSVTDRLN